MQETDEFDNLHKICLPEGLPELMSDISREVIRAQPQNVYSFIASYLSSLLEVRRCVFAAKEICKYIDDCCYEKELLEELKNIGLQEEDLEKTTVLVKEFLEGGSGKETNLFQKLLRKTSIEECQIDEVQRAVQNAFRRHWHKEIFRSPPQATRDAFSSSSLAGSYMKLPHSRPYSALSDILSSSSATTDTSTENTITIDATSSGAKSIKKNIGFVSDVKYITHNDDFSDSNSSTQTAFYSNLL